MTQYTTGRRFEYAVIKDLEVDGYDVIRAAGSKGKIDILAWKPGQILCIQAKSGKAWPPPSERAEVIRLARAIGGIPIIAYKTAGQAKPLYVRLTGVRSKDRVGFFTDFAEAP